MEDWILGVILALFIIVPCWLAILRSKETKRQVEAWSELARQTGMTYTPRYLPGVHGEYRGRYLSIALITSGDVDHEYMIYQNASIQVNVQNSACFALSIQGKRVLDYIEPASDFSSGSLDFDRHFHAIGVPHGYVQAALQRIVRSEACLLKWIMRNFPSIELNGETLTFSQNGELTSVNDQLALLDLLCDLAELTEKMGSNIVKYSEAGKE